MQPESDSDKKRRLFTKSITNPESCVACQGSGV